MNQEENTIDIIALRAIKPGEEVTINYTASSNKDPTNGLKTEALSMSNNVAETLSYFIEASVSVLPAAEQHSWQV